MNKYIFSIFILILVIGSRMTIAESNESIRQFPQKVQYMLLANEVSAQYAISAYDIKYVLKNESDYDPDAIGDHGKAISCGQYHKDEFDRYEAKYFKATGNHFNYNSCEDQIKLLGWQFANYPKSRRDWTTYRNLMKHKK